MDLQTRKIEFIQEFLKIDSEELIERFESMLKKKDKKSDDHLFKPFTMEEYNARIDQAMDDSRNGRMISAEDLLKEIDSWK